MIHPVSVTVSGYGQTHSSLLQTVQAGYGWPPAPDVKTYLLHGAESFLRS
jgi:hypothetical protein